MNGGYTKVHHKHACIIYHQRMYLWSKNTSTGYAKSPFYSIRFILTPTANGSTELRRVEVATVLGQEEGHAFQYRPGENDSTVWPGTYTELIMSWDRVLRPYYFVSRHHQQQYALNKMKGVRLEIKTVRWCLNCRVLETSFKSVRQI